MTRAQPASAAQPHRSSTPTYLAGVPVRLRHHRARYVVPSYSPWDTGRHRLGLLRCTAIAHDVPPPGQLAMFHLHLPFSQNFTQKSHTSYPTEYFISRNYHILISIRTTYKEQIHHSIALNTEKPKSVRGSLFCWRNGGGDVGRGLRPKVARGRV